MSGAKFNPDRDVADWTGPYRPYDLVKEFLIALFVVGLIIVGLTIVFSSPDDRPVTLQSWSQNNPVDFAQTAITELDGSSGVAAYGPPYVPSSAGASQQMGFFAPERWFGVHIPINTAQDYVIGPLRTLPDQPLLTAYLNTYRDASSSQQSTWTAAYEKVVANATFQSDEIRVARGNYGPVAGIIRSLTTMARSGALDGALLRSGQFYDTNYTKPLLFLANGSYLANLGGNQHLQGSQWGMMNETGNYPGQAWLWLYTLWYQVQPMKSSSNGDLEVWVIMMALTLLLALVPFIPGLRSVPRWSRVYRLIWRDHYRTG